MGLFDFLKGTDINEGIRTCQDTAGAVLIDVREADEYRSGHVPGARNLPLSKIAQAATAIPDRNTPLFVYCLSGARSRQAADALRQLGFTDARNIGGIQRYKGAVER